MTEDAKRAIIPADDTEFELMIAIVDPIQMVRNSGHNPQGWKFDGLPVAPQTSRFRLVRVDYNPELTYSRHLNDIRLKLETYGRIPEGQWREAFRRAYPCYDGNGPIGFADPSWIFPGGGNCFPALFGNDNSWCPNMVWVDGCRSNRWRWLITNNVQETRDS